MVWRKNSIVSNKYRPRQFLYMNKTSELFGSSGVDCVLLKTSESVVDENFYYFTRVDRCKSQNGVAILRKNKRPIILANILEYKNFAGSKGFSVIKISKKSDLSAVIKKLPKRIGVNYSALTLNSIKNLRSISKNKKFVDVSKSLEKIREVKTRDEQKKIKSACRISEEIICDVLGKAVLGKKEISIKNDIDQAMNKAGLQPAFPSIVASGKNSSVPHHVSGAKKVGNGVLLIDMGVVFHNYCSDITRTFFVGRASENVRNVYTIVKKAQSKGLSMIKDGARAADVFNSANDILKKELNQSLVHSLGHGIGINVHDFPGGFSEKSKTTLKKDMVFTVEPGYYKRFGVRIEDDIVVTKTGCRQLTKSPKEIIEL